ASATDAIQPVQRCLAACPSTAMNAPEKPTRAKTSSVPLPSTPLAFLWRYIRARPWHFGGLLALIIGAASCAVAVQYGMKLLVNAMAQGASDRSASNAWVPLWRFIGLIVVENVLDRKSTRLNSSHV